MDIAHSIEVSTIEDYLTTLADYKEKGETPIAFDDVRRLRIGFHVGDRDYWLSVRKLKMAPSPESAQRFGESPENVRKLLATQSGRHKLAVVKVNEDA